MRGAVCAASRLRAGASRALGASRRFGSDKTVRLGGLIPAVVLNGRGAPREARSLGQDWRMPSDAVASLWLEELEGLE